MNIRKKSSKYHLATLDKLKPGDEGVILNFSEDCPDKAKQLLLHYGFTEGSLVIIQFKNPWGDLYAVEIYNTLIAIRETEAKYIRVRCF